MGVAERKNKRYLIILAVLIVLGGCGNGDTDGGVKNVEDVLFTGGGIKPYKVEVENGNYVICIDKAYAISCNWEKYNNKTKGGS